MPYKSHGFLYLRKLLIRKIERRQMRIRASQKLSFATATAVMAASNAHACGNGKNYMPELYEVGGELTMNLDDIQITESRPGPHTLFRCKSADFEAKSKVLSRMVQELCNSRPRALPELWMSDDLKQLSPDAFNKRLDRFCRKVNPGPS